MGQDAWQEGSRYCATCKSFLFIPAQVELLRFGCSECARQYDFSSLTSQRERRPVIQRVRQSASPGEKKRRAANRKSQAAKKRRRRNEDDDDEEDDEDDEEEDEDEEEEESGQEGADTEDAETSALSEEDGEAVVGRGGRRGAKVSSRLQDGTQV